MLQQDGGSLKHNAAGSGPTLALCLRKNGFTVQETCVSGLSRVGQIVLGLYVLILNERSLPTEGQRD